ncbi:MAG TPA: hypothetical protein PLH57_00315 [Oligoflexia bacterium]|nr:hypothetical protein [Oligoflexia bacterium]
MDSSLVWFFSAIAIGALHAFEGDHLAAVSAFVARRPHWRNAMRFGGLWALGHAASLLVFAAVLVGLKTTFLPTTEAWFERVVGLVLVGLGTSLLFRAVRVRDSYVHTHSGRAPLLMGLLHGLAGTAGFLTQAVAFQQKGLGAVTCVALGFSIGVLVAMAGYSLVLGRVFSLGTSPGVLRAIQGLSGALIVVVGITRM